MFKIESYIAPLLMGYVDKYVKLNQEDFQISLWGGDAVLNNLDLRLDAIENAMQLPITFKSGHIHELRLHVPWTKLGSEPVVITINTIECILKLRDTAYSDTSSSMSEGAKQRMSQLSKSKLRRQEAEELPAGYLQSLMNKIVNNVNIIVNNLIIKFVEDDIVLSLNVKSAEVYSVDVNWMRSFVELTQSDLVLRRAINFCDLTLCLDKRDASGKIENYQDPLIYRCSVACRLHMTHDSIHNKLPTVTMLCVCCDKLDFSLTDTQLPMFIRLIELFLELYYGTFEFPSASNTLSPEPSHQEVVRQLETAEVEAEEEVIDEYEDEVGWGEWVWSFVPQILPEEGEQGVRSRRPAAAVVSIGFYAQKCTIMFKLTEKLKEKIRYGPQKVAFHPFLYLESEGIAVDVLLQGLNYFNIQVGLTNIQVVGQGNCICGVEDQNDSRSKVILHGGSSLQSKTTVNYLTKSLFDPYCPENLGQSSDFIFDDERHLKVYTEQYGTQKFGVFWMDYLYVTKPPDNRDRHDNGSRSSVSEVDDTLFVNENSVLRFLVGPFHLIVSSSMVHRLQKFIDCAYNYEYEPFPGDTPEHVDDDRPHPTENQVKSLEEFIPVRSNHLTILQPVITVLAAEHPYCDIKKKSYRNLHRSEKGSKSSSGSAQTQSTSSLFPLPGISLSADRFDLQVTTAMYPCKLVQLVSKMAGPSNNLLHHCHSHNQMKLFSFCVGLVAVEPSGARSTLLTVISPCSGALYKRTLLLSMYWKNSHLPKLEHLYELPQFSIHLTKASLLLIVNVLLSWQQTIPKPVHVMDDTLLEDIFSQSDAASGPILPILEVSLSGFEVKQCQTPTVTAYTGTLSSLQVVVFSKEQQPGAITPILYGPVDTSSLHSSKFFSEATHSMLDKNEYLTFTYQIPTQKELSEIPAVILMNTEGIVCCIDPVLDDWLSYCPRRKAPLSRTRSKESKVQVDFTLAHAASPLQANISQVSVPSSGSVTQTPTQTLSQGLSKSRTPSQPQSHKDQKEVPSKKTKEISWGFKMAEIFPLLRMLHVQFEVKNIVLFIPRNHLVIREPSMNIAQNVHSLLLSGQLPDMLVVCLPNICVQGTGMKPISVLQEIPITNMEGSLIGDKLPWLLSISNFSVYTLEVNKLALYLLKPLNINCTVAVTSKYAPPTSDNISSLGLCLHADMTAVTLCCSKKQTKLCAGVVSQLTTLGHSVLGLVSSISSHHSSKNVTETGIAHQPPLSTTLPKLGQNNTGPVDFNNVMTDTGTSGELNSRETSPSHELEIDDESTEGVKLSLWLQWTLPKLEIKFYRQNLVKAKDNKVSILFEDITSSVDIQEIYIKVKANVGSLNIHTYSRNSSNQQKWDDASLQAVVMTCRGEISRDTQIIASKLWISDGQPSPVVSHFTSSDSPRDITHGFVNVTFTRALCKNVKRRLKKMNVELVGIQDVEMTDSNYELYFHKFISEICVNVDPCDFVFNMPAVVTVLDCFDITEISSSKKASSKSAGLSQMSHSDKEHMTSPVLSASSLPLMYVNISTVRLFLPLSERLSKGSCDSSLPSTKTIKTTIDHDVLLFQLHSLLLSPQADNPLPRYPIDKELYHQSLQVGITQYPGSAVEDRQYQIDMKGMTLCTGCWGDFVEQFTPVREKDSAAIQIPALEWNTLLQPFQKVHQEEIRLSPLASGFDMRVLAAPAIVYHHRNTNDSKIHVVCGHSLEINVTSELDFYVSTNQVKLLQDLYSDSIKCLTSHNKGTVESAGKNCDLQRTNSDRPSVDSGVESDTSITMTERRGHTHTPPQHFLSCSASTATSLDQSQIVEKAIPYDILLTAGRIACTLYSHKVLEKDYEFLPETSKSKGAERKLSKSDLETKEEVFSTVADKYPTEDTVSEPFVGYSGSGIVADACSEFSFMNIHKRGSQGEDDRVIPGGSTCIIPFLYIYISQPHTVMSCHATGQKFEMSCYDVLLKGPPEKYIIPVSECRNMPDCSDYTLYTVETKAGTPDPKTGIPPSLYTLRMTDFMEEQACMSLRLERPLNIHLSLNKLTQITDFLTELLPSSVPSSDDLVTHVRDRELSSVNETEVNKVQKYLSKIDRLELTSEQIVVSIETMLCDKAPGFFGCINGARMDVEFQQNENGIVETVIGTIYLSDFMLKTSYEKTKRRFLGPCSINMEVICQWYEQSTSLPKSLVTMTTGLIMLNFGQEHVLCLDLMKKHCEDYFQDDEPVMTTGSKSKQKQKQDWLEFIVDQSTDDLRSGRFQYITDYDGSGLHASAGEIIFSSKKDDVSSSMTWCYSQPRVLSLVKLTPIPFSLSEEGILIHEVPCVMQYFDPVRRDFIDYVQFYISENQEIVLPIPEVKQDNQQELIVAQMWKVVIKPLILQQSDSEGFAEALTEEEPLILPASLAASMRIDTCFIPSLIPFVQGYLHAKTIQLHLSNHLQHCGSGVPSKLKPFHSDKTVPADQEFSVIVLQQPALITSHWQGESPRTSVQFSNVTSMEVLEYKNLTMQTILQPTEIYGDLSFSSGSMPELELNCTTEPVSIHVAQGPVHTLSCTAQVWTQIAMYAEPQVIFNHYVLCNNTHQTVRFGQVGTDENLMLRPREFHCYSWRSHKVSQQLHFCLDRPSWKWCESVDINIEETVVRSVQAKDQNYTMIIQVKQLSNIQKQIIITGQLVIASRLTQHTEVRVQTHGHEHGLMLGAGQTSPTYILEPEEIKYLQFRIMGHKNAWTKDVFVSGDRMKENRLLKIPLPDNSYMHVWCRVYCQHLKTATQSMHIGKYTATRRLVLLSPLYVLRSHLSCPLYVDMATPKLKEKRSFELSGQGIKFHLQCTGGDIVHNLSFKLGPSLQKSSTVLSLSTGLVDQIEHQPIEKFDIETLSNDCANEWPYTRTEQKDTDMLTLSARSSKSHQVDSDGQLKQPSVELNIRLLEDCPGCSTLLVDITPWCLMTNHSGMDLVVIDNSGKCWDLPKGRTFTPPKFSNNFALGVRVGEDIYQSDLIPLSEENVEYQRYRPDIGQVLFADGFVHTSILVINPSESQGYFLCLKSNPRHNMRIIEIQERFAFSNLTSILFQAKLFCVPLGRNKAKIPSIGCIEIPSHIKSDEDEVCSLINWTIQDEDRISLSDSHMGFVYYIMFRYNQDADWSYPVRLIANENGARFTLSVPLVDQDLLTTKALCIIGHEKKGVSYFLMQEDSAPFCAIHNYCSVPLHYGHTLMNLSLSGTTVHEETELIQCLPTVPPGGISYYTPSFVNNKFPEITEGQLMPKLHLAITSQEANQSKLVIPPISRSDKSVPSSHPLWSSGIDFTSQTEMFLSIPNVVDLKVQVKSVCMVTHVIVEPIGKAEVSAKEIRSRIKGKDFVSVTDEASCSPAEKLIEHVSKIKNVGLQELDPKYSLQISAGFHLKQLSLTILDDIASSEFVHEVLKVSMDSLFVSHYPASLSAKWDHVNRRCFAMSIEDIQIDNQLFGKGQYDFPVVFVKQDGTCVSSDAAMLSGLSVAEKQAVTKAASFAFLQVVLATDNMAHSVIESVEISAKPLSMFIDDTFILKILKELETFIPVKMSNGKSFSERKLPKEIIASSILLSSPIRIQHFCVHPVTMLLSVHASLKMFIASDRTPLSFKRLEKQMLYTTSHQLIRILAMHFASGVLFRAGIVVGSLEILGNPTGLLRSIGTGVADLVKMPYSGLTHGPGSFVAGVSKGMASLLKNVSGGMITSVTNFASSVSRNMDRLSMDTTHRERQEETRRHRPTGLSNGLMQGLTGFGLSMLGAVAGLADQPIQNMLSSNEQMARTSSTSDTAGRLVTGVGKGIVGVFTKPIGGAAELISQTGQGILTGTGLSKPPEPRCSAEIHDVSLAKNGSLKCVMKLLQSVSISDLLMTLEAEFLDLTGSLVPVVLLLTPEILCVLNCEEDAQQQAFSVGELECSADSSNPRLLTVFWHDMFQQAVMENENHNKDRVEAFIDATADYVRIPSVEASPVSHSTTSKSESSSSPSRYTSTVPQYQFYMRTEERETFLMLFQIACNKLSGRGFTV